MSRQQQDQQLSGTIMDLIRDFGKGLGALSSASGLLGITSVVVALVLIVTVPEIRVFGYIILVLGILLLGISFLVLRRRIASGVTGRRGKYGANTAIMSITFVAIIAVLNFVAYDAPARLDVTSTKQFTLSPRTIDVLDAIDQPVKAIAFFDQQNPDQFTSMGVIDDMLHEFQIRSDQFSYEILDPDVERSIANQYGVTSYGDVAFIALNSDEFRVARGAFLRESNVVAGTSVFEPNPRLEEAFVTPLLMVTKQANKEIAFLVGHGERSFAEFTEGAYSQAAQALSLENYVIRALDLQEQTIAPIGSKEDEEVAAETEEEAANSMSPAVIIVADPQKELLDSEAQDLKEFLMDGGRMVFLVEKDSPDSVRQFLSEWGVELSEEEVSDEDDFVRPDVKTPLISKLNPLLEITSILEKTYFPGMVSLTAPQGELPLLETPTGKMVMKTVESGDPWGTYVVAFEYGESGQSFIVGTGMARTSENSWTDEKQGPFSAAVLVRALFGVPIGGKIQSSVEDINAAQIVVFGDADFASNKDFNRFNNGDLFLNTVNYLAEDATLINIRPKPLARREILATPNEFDIIRYTSWFLLPAIMGMIGIFSWWMRR